MQPTGVARTITSLPTMARSRSASARSMAPRACANLQHRTLVAADDFSGESGLPQRKSERAADQAGADDRDLLDGHGSIRSTSGDAFRRALRLTRTLGAVSVKSLSGQRPSG